MPKTSAVDSSPVFRPSAELFCEAFARVNRAGVAPERVLWMVPRVDSAVVLKRQWAAWLAGEQDGKPQGMAAPVLSPMVQTADRLSQPRAQRPWLQLKALVVQVLRQVPMTQGLHGRALWTLAQEYLELAFRTVLIQQAHTCLNQYRLQGPFAELEAEVVVKLAEQFREELLALAPRLRPDWKARGIERVVWFDDGEVLPRFWLESVLDMNQVQLERIPLAVVQGPEDWRGLRDVWAQGGHRWALSIAPDSTAQAQQAAQVVTQTLRSQPDAAIAIAVLDRVAARRLIPVLEQAGVLVDDRTGWRFSTSVIAGWFHALLEAYSEAAEVRELEFPWAPGPVAGFEPWSVGTAHSLSAWAAHWLGFLERFGAMADLRADEAGKLLLGTLREFVRLHDEFECDAEGFLQAWASQAEVERFRPLDVSSPVVMLPLLSTRLRSFSKVVVLGCAQSHFKESPPGLLPPAVAQDLGFAGPSLSRVQKLSALFELLANNPDVSLIHCERVDGKPETLLPELQWLDVLLREADKEHSKARSDSHSGWSPLWCAPVPGQTIEVAPRQSEALSLHFAGQAGSPRGVPAQLNVTSLDDWVACPLRFGLKHALPWAKARDSGSLSFEQLRGSLVHKVLEKACTWMEARHQGSSALYDLTVWKDVLDTQLIQARQAYPLREQALLHPFVEYFQTLIPRVAGRLIERVAEGWAFEGAESQVQGALKLEPSGRTIQWAGRVDRLERKGDERRIVDIKFKKPMYLYPQAEDPTLAPQLPAYQALLGLHQAEMQFLSLNKDGVEWIPFAPYSGEHRSWGDALWHTLSTDLDRFFDGRSPWAATPGAACAYCEAYGVCRPDVDRLAEDEAEELSEGHDE